MAVVRRRLLVMNGQPVNLTRFFEDFESTVGPEILSYLRWESVLGLCCVSTLCQRAAYYCPRVEVNPNRVQSFNLARKSAQYVKSLIITKRGDAPGWNMNQVRDALEGPLSLRELDLVRYCCCHTERLLTSRSPAVLW